MAQHHGAPDDGKTHMFDKPQNVARVRYALYALCGISILAEVFVHRHVDHPWEALPLFYCLYGFAACVILVLIAKEMRKVLMRDEEYYDE
ncbi:MAG: hypothetical protein H6876_08270 [Hyphomicrobiaceae bacterium]|nr:hypothetical protein [Caldilineaceae bacterium]MCB1513368.1 hypothetical protein [Hyphomicrobiaceae bacterium]MCC0008103.1 hypothetical protein [Hyphomicrobiaceae bacterium]